MCIAAAAVVLISAYRPEKVFDWYLENGTVSVFLVALVCTYRWLPFSGLSYSLMLGYLCVHEWGAHFKYSDVPLGEWMKPWLGIQRNDYDRVAHFAFGFLLAYPMQEIFTRTAHVRGWWRYALPVEMTLSFSAIYEMLEAFMASILSPERGEEFVGMQGDMWDSQKDMFVAGAGSLLGVLAIAMVRSAVRARRAAAAHAGEEAMVAVAGDDS
jgi:putative membrane protein